MNARPSKLLDALAWRLAVLAAKRGTNYRVAPDDGELHVGARPHAPDGRKLVLRWRSNSAPQTITLLLTIAQGEALMLAIANADNAVHDAEDPGEAVVAQG